MAKKLTPKDFQKQAEQKAAEDEMKVRAERLRKAVKYQEKKFNGVVVPYYQYLGGDIQYGWIAQALPVKDKK